jgi:hypothetical protein
MAAHSDKAVVTCMGIKFSVQACKRKRVQASRRKSNDAVKLAELNDDSIRVKEHARSVPLEIGVKFRVVKVFGVHSQEEGKFRPSLSQKLKQSFRHQAIQFLERRHICLPANIRPCPNLRRKRDNGAGLSKDFHALPKHRCFAVAIQPQYRQDLALQPDTNLSIPAARAMSLSQKRNCCKEFKCRSMRGAKISLLLPEQLLGHQQNSDIAGKSLSDNQTLSPLPNDPMTKLFQPATWLLLASPMFLSPLLSPPPPFFQGPTLKRFFYLAH